MNPRSRKKPISGLNSQSSRRSPKLERIFGSDYIRISKEADRLAEGANKRKAASSKKNGRKSR
jgi:hypothetical protein